MKTTFYPNKIFTFTSERDVAFDPEDRKENPMYDREENPFLLEGIPGLPENLQAQVDDTAVFAYYSSYSLSILVDKTGEAAGRGAGSRAHSPNAPEGSRLVWLVGNSAEALVEAAEEEGATKMLPLEKSTYDYERADAFVKGDDFEGLTELEHATARYMKGNGPLGYALILFDNSPRTSQAFAEYLDTLFGSFVDVYFVEGEDDSDFPEDPLPPRKEPLGGFTRTRRAR